MTQSDTSDREIERAVEILKRTEQQVEEDPTEAYKHKDDVLDEYQSVFQPDKVQQLSEEKFKEFLLFENNKHWTGLHRRRATMTEDMDELRDNLHKLVSESEDISDRVQHVKENVDGVGKATLSAILVTAAPEEYGVWNNRSEEALKQLDLWPDFEWGTSFGDKYSRVNEILNQLADGLDVDLWDLDSILGYHVSDAEDDDRPIHTDPDTEFAKEEHLKQYLVSQWDQTGLSDDWEIYGDSEDPQAGVEFSTGIGRPDILLVHSEEDRVCVVELKRSRTSDRAVGQTMRYMGWVQEHHDELEDVGDSPSVEGLIVGSQPSEKLRYAVDAHEGIGVMSYEIDVELSDIESL